MDCLRIPTRLFKQVHIQLPSEHTPMTPACSLTLDHVVSATVSLLFLRSKLGDVRM